MKGLSGQPPAMHFLSIQPNMTCVPAAVLCRALPTAANAGF